MSKPNLETFESVRNTISLFEKNFASLASNKTQQNLKTHEYQQTSEMSSSSQNNHYDIGIWGGGKNDGIRGLHNVSHSLV